MKEEKDSKKSLEKNLQEQLKRGNNFINEFKTFIARGNVMELAVGVIVGNAFSKIVTSLTDNILMPLIGVLIGGFDFSNLAYKFNLFNRMVELKYGIFIQNTVDFLITAFCIFLVIKVMNNLFKKSVKEEQEVKEQTVKEEVVLLTEIRDLLKEKNVTNNKQNKKKGIKKEIDLSQ